jgi:hypothetical protein
MNSDINGKVCCFNCENFMSSMSCSDKPHPVFWCNKGKWDGITSIYELYEAIDCDLFIAAKGEV